MQVNKTTQIRNIVNGVVADTTLYNDKRKADRRLKFVLSYTVTKAQAGYYAAAVRNALQHDASVISVAAVECTAVANFSKYTYYSIVVLTQL